MISSVEANEKDQAPRVIALCANCLEPNSLDRSVMLCLWKKSCIVVIIHSISVLPMSAVNE